MKLHLKTGHKANKNNKVGEKFSKLITFGGKLAGQSMKKIGGAGVKASALFGQPELGTSFLALKEAGIGLKHGSKGLEKIRKQTYNDY